MSYRFVYGDLLSIRDVDAICHQVNCLTIIPHGLSLELALTYPWTDIYSRRKGVGNRNLATLETRGIPGKIKIFKQDLYPAVICMHAQNRMFYCFVYGNLLSIRDVDAINARKHKFLHTLTAKRLDRNGLNSV